MSTTALILTQSVEQRAALVKRFGRPGVDNSIFVLAARLIAGTYTN